MNRPTRFYSNIQEKKVAKATSGKQTSNSGATKFQKGDVVSGDWLIECKTKTSASKTFTVHKDWIVKNKEEAFAMGKSHTAVAFDFGDGEDIYYIISEKDFIKLIKGD